MMYNYRYLLAGKLLENNINVDIYGSSTNILKKNTKGLTAYQILNRVQKFK